MQPAALRALEFDRVVEMVRAFAMTPMGDERISRLAPSPDPQKVAQLLAATTETAKYLAANGLFPLRSGKANFFLSGALGGADVNYPQGLDDFGRPLLSFGFGLAPCPQRQSPREFLLNTSLRLGSHVPAARASE